MGNGRFFPLSISIFMLLLRKLKTTSDQLGGGGGGDLTSIASEVQWGQAPKKREGRKGGEALRTHHHHHAWCPGLEVHESFKRRRPGGASLQDLSR